MDDNSEQLARLEEMGEESVRILLHTAGFTIAHQRLAIKWLAKNKWLAKKDQESARRRDASQAEQIDIARSAKDAAWEAARAANKANTIAAIAVVMAIIAIIISTFAWVYPRH